MTDNHNYNRPEEGSQDWHIPLNENFDQIDTDVEIRDEESNIENYEPKAGAKFLALDTGVRYIGDGSSWNELGVSDPVADRLERIESRLDDLESGTSDEATGSEETDVNPKTRIPFDSQSSLDEFSNSYSMGNVSIVSNPAYENSACEIRIQEGGHEGASMHYLFDDQWGYEPEELHARYWLRFSDNWNSNWNGKLPGFGATDGETVARASGRPNGYDGWSARGSFYSTSGTSDPVDIGYYVYHPEQSSQYGDHVTAGANLERGTWYQIDQRVELNTPGENDGVLQLWIDEELYIDENSFRFRDTSDLKIESYWGHVYHGGSEPSPNDMAVYWDELSLDEAKLL
ncbi:polysaccharide lyase [Halosolutus amylolyticus]|uniref:Polysaccharide lyase n=1 Tax=Halosolutus amylolyticus TaxID=2932267 RepID=A0ABD5PPK9_9EURY|nr:hypothetical protein [Halosolutus amylolyticus]